MNLYENQGCYCKSTTTKWRAHADVKHICFHYCREFDAKSINSYIITYAGIAILSTCILYRILKLKIDEI